MIPQCNMNKQAGFVMVRGHVGIRLKGVRQAEGKEDSRTAIEQREEENGKK